MSGSNIIIGANQTQTITNSETVPAAAIDDHGTLVVSGAGTDVTIDSLTFGPGTLGGEQVEVTGGASLDIPEITGGSANGADYGTLDINSGTIEMKVAPALQPVSFGPLGGDLILDMAGFGFSGGGSANGPIYNFAPGDTIDIAFPVQSDAYVPNVNGPNFLDLYSGPSATGSLDVLELSGNSSSGFNFNTVTLHGTSYTQITPCYAAGTRIATAQGEVAVEDLRAGDLVVTMVGKDMPLRPVKWLGWREIDVTAHARPELVWPVRIRAGAFGDGMPRRDLVVSPDHALFLDGVLIAAGKLLNGVTVLRDLVAGKVRYFHVELDSHAILMAEGMPAESYLDTGNRSQFANGEGVVALHPDFAPKRMQTDACAPFVEDGPALATVRGRLIERIAAQGFVVSGEPDLRLVVNGRLLDPVSVDGQTYRFELPEAVRDIRIVSRTGHPGGTSAENEDIRPLGVCVQEMVLHAAGAERPIGIDHPALGAGFDRVEGNGAVSWRWTDGDAALPVSLLDGLAGRVELEVRLLWKGAYWTRRQAPEKLRRSA